MPRITIGLGAILTVLGVIAWIITDFASWTALIPSILGVVILICGIIGIQKPKIGIHIALVVALVGMGGTARNIFPTDDLMGGEPAAIFSAITFVLLLIYIILGIQSFIRARRRTS